VVRSTKKLLRLAGPVTAVEQERGTTLLGPWYATVLFWQPRVVLLVNELTLLPVLMPLAPMPTLPSRIAEQITAALIAHHVPATVVAQERRHMEAVQLGTTANRSVVGVMTEFARMTEIYRDDEPNVDLLTLAAWLGKTPCGPLYKRHVSPDRELAAAVAALAT